MKVKYFAWLKEITKVEEENIDDPSITNVNILKNFLSIKYPKLKKNLKKENLIRIAINLSYTYKNDAIKPSDEVALFPPVSGG